MSRYQNSRNENLELVLLKSRGSNLEPYTTQEIIADCAEVRRRTVDRLIMVHKTDLEEFGVLRFEIAKPTPGSKGGRPENIYHLNEQQATLLITYLKNTAPVRAFKKELVRQFYAMRKELARRRELRAEGKPIRRSLTDALRDSGENERMHGHAYGAYTDLAYRLTTGKSAARLRRERGALKKAVAANFLTSEELAAYQKQEAALATLIDAGLRYQQIKAVLLGRAAAQGDGEEGGTHDREIDIFGY